jgi:DNA-binding NarL/FixJ family response regulator
MPISLVLGAPSTLANDVLCRGFNQRRKHFNVVGSAHTRKDFLKLVGEHQPDVALIDANLENKPGGGLRALRELSLTRSSTRAIVLLDCSESEQVVEAFSQGARGAFCKCEGFTALCKCIRGVRAGEVWADSSQLQLVVQALRERKPVRIVSATGTPLLTKRAEQIVRMVAEGLPNREISKSLGLSPHTVKNHLFRIYDKLGISNRAELLLYALASRDVAHCGDDPPKQSAS